VKTLYRPFRTPRGPSGSQRGTRPVAPAKAVLGLCALALLACPASCFGQEARYSPAGAAEQPRSLTWDKFFYKVQLPVKAAAPASAVKLFVYHSYAGPLHDVCATGKSASLVVTRQPAALRELDPTEIASFNFAVQRTGARSGPRGALQGPRGAADRKQASLTIALRARELPGEKPIEVTVPLTAKAEEELLQQLSVPVGTMEVRIGGWGNQMYFLYLLPMLGLLGWMLWRRRRLARL